MRFHIRIEKENVGCGVPGCSEGCDSSASLDLYLLATSEEDAKEYAEGYFDYIAWENSSFTVKETTVEFPEMTVWHTADFQAQEYRKAYAEAEAEMKKAQDELYVLVKYAADHETLQKAMDKWRYWIEECAFLRGG